ncbi:MAG: reverse transcriptase domain-containing protein, partial [Gaiellaceae bacterium]
MNGALLLNANEVREAEFIDYCGSNVSSFIPAPTNLANMMRIKDQEVKKAWLRATRKELKTLIDHGTFMLNDPKPGEIVTPCMDTYRVKIKSDGTLDKLKVRIVVRGDLQKNVLKEDTWSPTASIRLLKVFLAHAAKKKCKVKQLDFIGAFLQANVRERIFVKLPALYGELFPEFAKYSGRPLQLNKSMYGMTYSGRFWWQDLSEWLL